jgi:hypothetical protein
LYNKKVEKQKRGATFSHLSTLHIMSLFSKLSKSNDKTLYPWSQKKLGGTNNALPRFGHAAVSISSDAIIVYGGIHRGSIKKDLLQIDTSNHIINESNCKLMDVNR